MRSTNVPFNSSLLSISQTEEKYHPQILTIVKKATRISRELNIIIEGYDDYVTMASYLFPWADLEKVVDATMFFNTLYYLDNIFGEDTFDPKITPIKPELISIRKVWNTGHVKPSGKEEIDSLLQGIRYLKDMFEKNSNEGFIKKLTRDLVPHLQHALRPADFKTLEDYMSTRFCFGGMEPTLDLFEYVYEIYLPDHLFKKGTYLRELKTLSNNIGGLSNDIFSYPNEAHSKFNLINAALEIGIADNFDDSIAVSIQIVNDFHARFVELYRRRDEEIQLIAPQFREHAARYIEAMADANSASYHWQKYTRRYQNSGHFLEDFR